MSSLRDELPSALDKLFTQEELAQAEKVDASLFNELASVLREAPHGALAGAVAGFAIHIFSGDREAATEYVYRLINLGDAAKQYRSQ